MVEVATPTLRTEVDDDLLTVRLHRPDRLNAIDDEMLDGLLELFETLASDPTHAVRITGTGRATCAGVDLDVVEQPRSAKPTFREREYRLFALINDYPRPTAVAGKGAVVGAAFIVALTADFVVLGEETTFSFPEIKYGIHSEWTAATLAETVGRRAAKDIVLRGEPIPPERALGLGLATEVIPEAEVESRTAEILREVGGYDPEAVRATKDRLGLDFGGE